MQPNKKFEDFCFFTLIDLVIEHLRSNIHSGLGYDSQALKYEDRGIAFLSPHELPESQPPSTETSHHWQVPNPACFLDEDKVVRCNQLQGKNMTYSYKGETCLPCSINILPPMHVLHASRDLRVYRLAYINLQEI